MFSTKNETLKSAVKKALRRFPKTLDGELMLGLYRLLGCTKPEFVTDRTEKHLKKILLAQFFLQKQLTKSKENHFARGVHVHLFCERQCFCISTALSYQRHSEIITEQHILNAFKNLIAGIELIPGSSYIWQFPGMTSLFCYFEVRKSRGYTVSVRELKALQNDFKEEILKSIISCCPAVFWPYNHEESFRQILILNKEIQTHGDLPHTAIHFQGQTARELEFLIHLVYPHKESSTFSIDTIVERLSPSMRLVVHYSRTFSLTTGCSFSLFLPTSQPMYAVNLLKKRQAILALLEDVIGPIRDYNGGLFTKQEEAFAALEEKLAERVPGFNRFAENLFYSLKPIEQQFTLPFSIFESLFSLFSSVMLAKQPFFLQHHAYQILVIKSNERKSLESLISSLEITFAFLQLEESYFLSLIDPTQHYIKLILKKIANHSSRISERKILRIPQHTGQPSSLNPHYLAPDLQFRTIYKALFEGLTRLNSDGQPALAGAREVQCSNDKCVYTFFLRANRWSNAEKVTAWQYMHSWRKVFSFKDRLNAHHLSVFKNGEKILKNELSPDSLGVYARNDHILEVHLERPDPQLLKRLSQPLFFPIYGNDQEPKVFNGPYSVHSFNSQSLVLECNPYFWNNQNLYFETIEFNTVSEVEHGIELYKLQKIDWIGDPFFFLKKENLHSLEKLRHQKVARPFWLYFNMNDAHLTSPNVRHALRLSIDLEKGRDICGYDAKLPISYIPSHSCDPYLAKDFLRKSNLNHLTLSYSPIIGGEELANALKRSWENYLGVNITLQAMEWNAFLQALQKGTYQVAGCFISPVLNDSLEFLERLTIDNPLNFSHFQNLEYMALIKKIRETYNLREKKILLNRIHEILLEEAPCISLFSRNNIYAHTPSLSGYVIDESGGVDLCYAYLD